MQTYAFAKVFSHFYLWTVKRLQKAARANSPHLRQFANCTPSSLTLTIQQTTQPLNGHVDPNFQQLNSICILQKRLQETTLTPLHIWSHCRVQENSWLAHSPPDCWNYFGCCSLWLCCVKGEARREQARTNTECSMQAGPRTGSARLPNIRAHEEFPSQDGNGATEVATLSRDNLKGGWQELEEEDHCHLPKEIQLACFPSPPPSLKRSSQGTIC